MSRRVRVRDEEKSIASDMARIAIDMRMARSSGIGTYIRQLVPRLPERSGSLRYDLLGDAGDLDGLGLRGEATTVHPCTSAIYSPLEQLELARRTPADVDLFWSPHYNIPLLHPGKLLVTIHDVLHIARPEYVRGAHRRAYARAMFAAVKRRAARIICDSRFTADELVRLTRIDPRRISVVCLGVDSGWFRTSADEPPYKRPYFLYVGNVKPHKNLATLVAAFEELLRELPHDLVIVGRREGFITGDEALVGSAERLGGRLRFTGELPDEEVRRHVGNAEALVLPSLYEGFGLPALEAMAAGCPALVSRRASLPEVCGDAALYFDPDDPGDIAGAMRRVTEDAALRQDLIAAGRERARGFTWEKCADETLQVIEEVLER